jgi:phosphoribosylformimino-5-aminoimidazole carboxamide ribotide isomerase
MSPIVPIPAIDIRDGHCVRLLRGDFGRQTVYGDDPVGMARRWEAEGAERLHIVDLDGARNGVRANVDVIRRAIDAVHIPVQVGGGVRSLDIARQLLDDGADRVIVGTAAAEHPEQLSSWLDALGPERVIVGVDARNGRVAIRGWLETSPRQVPEFCQKLKRLGVLRVLFTDIDRDGMLDGPNVDATRSLAALLKVIASGGVSTTDDLQQLAEAGAEAVVIGKALYDGRLSLKDAIAAAAC